MLQSSLRTSKGFHPHSPRSDKIDTTRSAEQPEDHFYVSQGIRKRRIYYKVKYSAEEQQWIKEVHHNLKKQKHIDLQQKETLLRYYYCSNMEMQQCLNKLVCYHNWFTSKEIQTLSKPAKKLLQDGFIYSYGVGKEGRAFIIMNLGDMDLQKYKLQNYYQALNHVNSRVIKQVFIPGHIQTYDYVLDMNEKFLGLPVSSIQDIIKTLSDVYSMRLHTMHIVNVTQLAKWLYYAVQKFIHEQTSRKIKLYTKGDLQDGILREFIDEAILEQKYGGTRPNIDHSLNELIQIQEEIQDYTEYFSIEENNQMFFANNQKALCCGTEQCKIY